MSTGVNPRTHAAEFRRCLLEVDVRAARALWKYVHPELPELENDEVTLVTLHMARTGAKSIPFKLRAWSHSWLTEHGLESNLPDNLRPRAERMYSRIVTAVGVSVMAMSESSKDLAVAIEKAMSDAVLECYAEGKTDPEVVKARMQAAREKIMKGD